MEKFDIFDTHTHLNVDDLAGREAEELALAKKVGVTRHSAIGFDVPIIKRAVELAEKSPETYAAIGRYPTGAGSYNQEIGDMIVVGLSYPRVIGLGEIGLDYYQMEDPKDTQMEVFKRQARLLRDRNLPLTVHTRDVLEDTYAVIKEAGIGPRGRVIRSFSGSLEMAERFIEPGMMTSFLGIVTFKKALNVQEAAQRLPLDKILVEAGAPYLAPIPERGRENHTTYTRYVVDKIAELRGLTSGEMTKATSDNAGKLLNCDRKNQNSGSACC